VVSEAVADIDGTLPFSQASCAATARPEIVGAPPPARLETSPGHSEP
jgi:hypothetical protein